MAQNLFTTGSFQFIQVVRNQAGVLEPISRAGSLPQLHGMLGHINSIDRHNADHQEKPCAEDDELTATSKENLYRRFLLFKEFYAAERPVLICEGKTDNSYLKHAIRSLAASYPDLASVSADGKVELKIRIFKYPNTSTGRILSLRGGTGDLKNLVEQYSRVFKKIKAPGANNPVIILADNDAGSTPICSIVHSMTKEKQLRDLPFVKTTGNLYVVLTPRAENNGHSLIEDSFTAATRGVVLDGKQLSLANDADTERYFGKYVFSKYIEKNASQIDFRGFANVLDRLRDVIQDYRRFQGARVETTT